MQALPFHENIPFTHKKFPVNARKYIADATLRPHWHEHIEYLYFTDGEGSVTCNEKTFSVKKGDLIVVNPSEIHTYTPKETLSFCCILLYPWFFSDSEYPRRVQIENCIRGDKFAGECIEAIMKEASSDEPCARMLVKSHAYTLTAHLLRHYASHEMTDKDTAIQQTKLKRAETLLYYISNHYQEKITSKVLSDLCYMNESHFCRFFKKAFGKTPTDYINEYRIEKACDMLLSTDRSITEIALSVGFEDINYFSRTFKKRQGVTPTEFRAEKTIVKN